jgi:hypothetical protein
MSASTAVELPQQLSARTHSEPGHGWKFWVGITLALVAVLIGVGVGAFLGGRATRPSDGAISHRLSVQSLRQKVFYDGRQAAALAAQKKSLATAAKKRAAKAQQQGYANGQASGYANGQAQGFSSGSTQGKQEGKKVGRRQGRAQGAIDGYLQGYNDGSCTDPSTGGYVC